MKRILALVLAAMMLLSMAACAASTPAAAEAAADTNTEAVTGVEDGVLTVGMECAYAPYNWTQMDDSNGAVPISNVPGAYANGYDVMIAQKICEANGWQLEIVSSAWDSLLPGCAVRHDGCEHCRSVHDRRPYAGGRHGRPVLLRHHRLRHHKGQPLCQCGLHCRPRGRQVHRAVRHDLVRFLPAADRKRRASGSR